MNARLREESQKECQTEVEMLELTANTSFQETSGMKKEQMRRELRATVEKTEGLEAELHTIQKLTEDQAADGEYERAYMMKRIEELEDSWTLLYATLTEEFR